MTAAATLDRRKCSECGMTKQADVFAGGAARCRSCARLRHIYGLTFEQYSILLEKQGYKCAICRKDFKASDKICIDHDHDCCESRSKTCGDCIRGVLCWPCNVAIGHLGDSIDRLLSAARYLSRGALK